MIEFVRAKKRLLWAFVLLLAWACGYRYAADKAEAEQTALIPPIGILLWLRRNNTPCSLKKRRTKGSGGTTFPKNKARIWRPP